MSNPIDDNARATDEKNQDTLTRVNKHLNEFRRMHQYSLERANLLDAYDAMLEKVRPRHD